MKNNRFTTAQLTLLGLMAAILLLMAYTPLGYLNIGPLAISFNAMGVVLFGINPVFAFIQRFIPRLLDGICLGYIFKGMRKVSNTYVACAVTGFFSAFLNTLFFMSALVGLFGNTDYVKNLMGGHNIIIGCCLMVGINAVCEMISSTVITGAVGAALSKAHLIPSEQISREKTKA